MNDLENKDDLDDNIDDKRLELWNIIVQKSSNIFKDTNIIIRLFTKMQDESRSSGFRYKDSVLELKTLEEFLKIVQLKRKVIKEDD